MNLQQEVLIGVSVMTNLVTNFNSSLNCVVEVKNVERRQKRKHSKAQSDDKKRIMSSLVTVH